LPLDPTKGKPLEPYTWGVSPSTERIIPLPAKPNFESTILPHLDAAYNLARWLLRDPTLAQDVVQDAALRAYHYFDSFTGGNARAWFLHIVRNAALTHLTVAAKTATLPLDAETITEIADPTPNPEQTLLQSERAQALNQALAALPLELRECLVLRELEEFSYREIATVTNTAIGTVMSRLWRARQMLGAAIDKGNSP